MPHFESGSGRVGLRPLALCKSWMFALLTAALLLLQAASAWAAVDGKVAVGEFRGSKAQGLRTLVISVLRDAGYKVLGEDDTPDLTDVESDSDFARVARQQDLRAFVLARTALTKRDWKTKFTVREGKSGRMLGEFELKGRSYPGLQSAIETSLAERIAEPLASSESTSEPPPKVEEPAPEPEPEPKPAAKDEPEPVAEKPEEPVAPKAEEEPKSEAPAPKQTALELAVGPNFVQRHWAIKDAITDPLAGRLAPFHDVSLPGAHASLRLYPAAFFTSTAWRHFALEGEFERSLWGSTVVTGASGGDDKRATTFTRLTFGLFARIPAGFVELAVFGGAGGEMLTLEGEKVMAAMPDVSTRFVRMGAGIDFILGESFRLGIFGAQRYFFDIGDRRGELASAEWFPNVQGRGFDALLQADITLATYTRLRISVAGSRQVYDFHSKVEQIAQNADDNLPAPPIAGGASDLYVTGRFGVVLTLPAL